MIKIKTPFTPFFQRISKNFPALKHKLKQAGMDERTDEFIEKSVTSAGYMTIGVVIFLFLVLSKLDFPVFILFLMMPVAFAVMSFYMLRFPDARIAKKEKEISKEIVFAGRFLIIELESGVPLYNAMKNISRNFDVIGRYFREITDKVDLGTSIEDALNDAVEYVPSQDFRKILWQVINSMRTGSNVAKSLYSVMDQITRDQLTEVNKYGKKLNPLAMFYMIIAVILPSLGITMLIILSSFIEFELNLTILLVLSGFLAFVQYFFVSIVKFSRPAIDF